MSTPSLSDLSRYTGTLLNGVDWNSNIDQIISFFTTDYDVTFGDIVADTLVADISNCTGFPGSNVAIIAGENLTAGNCVRVSGNKAYKTTSATAAGIKNFLGIVVSTVLINETANVTRTQYDSFSGLDDGETYYLDTNGAITLSKPATYAKPIGYAISSTSLILSDLNEANNTFADVNIAQTLTLSTQPSCSVYNSASQTFADSTGTLITFNSEYWDSGSLHSTSVNTGRITISKTGWYLINMYATWQWAAGGYRRLYMQLNGSGIWGGESTCLPVVSGQYTTQSINVIRRLTAGDYFTVFGYQNSGGTLDLAMGLTNTSSLSVYMLPGTNE